MPGMMKSTAEHDYVDLGGGANTVPDAGFPERARERGKRAREHPFGAVCDSIPS